MMEQEYALRTESLHGGFGICMEDWESAWRIGDMHGELGISMDDWESAWRTGILYGELGIYMDTQETIRLERLIICLNNHESEQRKRNQN